VVINEIESSALSGGQDFIELKNTASSSIDITGMILSDNDNLDQYVIPSTTLAPGALYTVDINNVVNGFGLGGDDAVRLFRAGTTVNSTAIPLDHHEWTAHAPNDPLNPTVDKTYTRTASGLGEWVVCTSTKNAANAC
jgi:hypothetical protein